MLTVHEEWRMLAQHGHFIVHNNKVPTNPTTGEPIDPHNVANGIDLDQAVGYVNLYGAGWGLGFVIRADSPIHFLDIDHCVVNGQWSPVATEMLSLFRGAYVEVSMSGEGLHILFTGAVPPHSCKNKDYGLELYTQDRYVALTGLQAAGSVMYDCSLQAADIVARYFPPNTADGAGDEWSDQPVPEWSGPDDDQQLIEKMLRSGGAKAIFGGGVTFADLWYANAEKLGLKYPPNKPNDPFDRSNADAALAQHLAFWTGKNHERMVRLMWMSALQREKWTGHKKYLKTTVTNAVRQQKDVYNDRRNEVIPVAEPLMRQRNGIEAVPWGTLSKKTFEEMKWIVNSFLPPGASLIAGRPKQGKSWLVHAIALLVAAGKPVFGHITTKSDVWYMALEDSERRLQGRTRQLMRTHHLADDDIQGFHYSIDAPTLGSGLEEQIAEKLHDLPAIRLVIIDVLARIRPPRRGNQSVYDADYEIGRRIKTIAASYPEVAFLVVHHQNKTQGDNLDSVSGTHGLAGGFDNLFGMISGSNGMELHIDGRDIEDSAPIPLLKGDDGMWTLESREEATKNRNSDTRNAILSAMGDTIITQKELAEITGIDSNTINSSLRRMVSQNIVVKLVRGQYRRSSTIEINDFPQRVPKHP